NQQLGSYKPDPRELNSAITEIAVNTAKKEMNERELQLLTQRTNLQENTQGHFVVKSPRFPTNLPPPKATPHWTVLNSDFREHLFNRKVSPSDPLLRLGYKEGPWEIELKIPQKHIGQVLAAYQHESTEVLDVDLLVRSDPTHIYKGKLHRNKIGGEAKANQSDNNESDPIVLAYVRIEGDDIAKDDRLPLKLLVADTDVHAKVRCGNRKMGYSLFYGVWEFLYEKVVFF